MREIHLTPIPAAEHRPGHEAEVVTLICRECDLVLHAEGQQLSGLAEAVDDAHALRHRQERR